MYRHRAIASYAIVFRYRYKHHSIFGTVAKHMQPDKIFLHKLHYAAISLYIMLYICIFFVACFTRILFGNMSYL